MLKKYFWRSEITLFFFLMLNWSMIIKVQLSFFFSEWKSCCYFQLLVLPDVTVVQEDITRLCQRNIWVLFFHLYSLWGKMNFWKQPNGTLCGVVPIERKHKFLAEIQLLISVEQLLAWRSGEVSLKVTLSEEPLRNITEVVMFHVELLAEASQQHLPTSHVLAIANVFRFAERVTWELWITRKEGNSANSETGVNLELILWCCQKPQDGIRDLVFLH